MRYDAVLFDNDGVLTHLTEREVLARAVRNAFDDVGVAAPDPDDVRDLQFGVTVARLTDICADYDVDPARFWARRDHHATRLQQDEIAAGNKPLYDDFDAILDVPGPRGIVSSNQHPTVERILEHNDISHHFDTYYGREMSLDGIRRKKPATYYLDRAVADIGAENPVYVGDSETDVEAARNAGMDAIFLRRPHRQDTDLSVEPTAEIRTLGELRSVVDGAP
ncbi:MAG: HAD family hydrolase [Halanaeroarchaeum sp.]